MSKPLNVVKTPTIQTEEEFLKELAEEKLGEQRIGISDWLWTQVLIQFRKEEYENIREHFLWWVKNIEAAGAEGDDSYCVNFRKLLNLSIPLEECECKWGGDEFIGPFLVQYLIVHVQQDGCVGSMFSFSDVLKEISLGA